MPMKYYEQIKNQEIPPMDTGDVPAFLIDIVISEDTEKPITSGLFRLEKGESLTYTYTYHEMKLIVDGTLIIEDENGQKIQARSAICFTSTKVQPSHLLLQIMALVSLLVDAGKVRHNESNMGRMWLATLNFH